jgi:HK97 family phage portal protein
MLDGVQVEVESPPVLTAPDGKRMDICEWLYCTQLDLDRTGNAFGVITARDSNGLPARIQLVDVASSSVIQDSITGEIKYRLAGKEYPASDVWHERQFTVSGLPVGLSPVAVAAWSIGQFLSAQEFGRKWFASGAVPTGDLKNIDKRVNAIEAVEISRRFKSSVTDRGVFVHGRDWEYKPIAAADATKGFIEAQQFGVSDICRFFGVPGDLVEAAIPGSSVTYANIGQRNMQLLIMNIGPAVVRREKALSRLLPEGRFVKINTDALLRMDPQTRAAVLGGLVNQRLIVPSEARALDNRAPYTEAQLAEFDRIFGKPGFTESVSTSSATSVAYSVEPGTAPLPTGGTQ